MQHKNPRWFLAPIEDSMLTGHPADIRMDTARATSSAHATVVLGLDMWMRRFRSMGVATTTASAGTALIVFARSSTCRYNHYP